MGHLLFWTFVGLAGVATLVCFILVLVRMFQAGQTGLGVTCIVLTFCTGVGPLIAFIVGWINAAQWNIRNVMLVWTAIIVLDLAATGWYFTYIGGQVRDWQEQQQLQSP